MYEGFYGLPEPPFRLTPDPRYVYLSAQHREALGHLLFGIREGSGFIAVTGEIGTGKTTLLRTLLRDLDPSTVAAYLFNPMLSDVEILQAINGEFRLPAGSRSKKELVDELNRFLMAQKLAGTRAVVVVDEAQNLAPPVLEQLRLLSNLETETDKLLQIVLVGQPELRHVLGRPELAQLNQRITVRWHLAALDRRETAEYVRHRLRVCGGSGAARLFTPAALRLLHSYARGVPRLVNITADRALLVGFTREERSIGRRTVRRAIRELTRGAATAPAERRRLLGPALGATLTALVLAVVAALAFVPPDRGRSLPLPAAGDASIAPAGTREPAVPRDAAVPTEPRRDLAPRTGPGTETAPGHDEPDEAAGDLPPPATGGDAPEIAAAAKPITPAELHSAGVPERDAAAVTASDAHAAAAFWGVLTGIDHRAAAVTATGDLLAMWGAEPLGRDERASETLDMWGIASRRGLRYLATSGNLARLQLLDLPAILELSVPPSGQRRFAVLLDFAGDHVHLRLGETVARLSTTEIESAWLGDAHLFWRDFENLSAYLTPGSSGPDVLRLQRLLARVGEYQGAPSSVYDRTTAEAIARFQRSRRLMPDGIVGPLTKIALYAAIPGYRSPRLSGST